MGSHPSLSILSTRHKSSNNSATMSTLLKAMSDLKSVFDKYAGKDGDNKTLSKAELTVLLRTELPGAGSKAEMDKFFSMLDHDKDGVVDFTEYVTFVASLTVIINEGK